jgi:hypothetical protein
MNNRVIVWDLETIPNLMGFAAANGLSGKSDAAVPLARPALYGQGK